MSTIVDFPPRSAPAERTAVVEMEGPLNRLDDLLGALLERVENNDNPCIYSLTDDKGTEGAIMCLSQRVAPPPPVQNATAPDRRKSVVEMQTSLQVLSDLLRGLMALAANSTDVSDLPACHSLARGAQGRLEKLWDLWTEFNEWAGKE